MKKQIPQIKYSNLQPVTSYVADFEGDEKLLKILENVGKKVITKKEYVLIGFNHVIAHAKNNKFELNSIEKNNLCKKEVDDSRNNKRKISKFPLKKMKIKKEMKNKTQMIDPPSGWLYGFPKPYDKKKDGDLKDFFKKNGYPEKDINFALENCRMWNVEENNENR